jgi:hypothetical protein
MQYEVTQQTNEDQLQPLVVVSCNLPARVKEITDLEVFFHEIEQRLVIKLGETVTNVPLESHCGSFSLDPNKVRARYVKKRGTLVVTLPTVSASNTAAVDVARLSLSGSLSVVSGLMEFPPNSPLKIEIRPLPTGRCLVATRKIMPGEMVMFEEPLALLRLGQGDVSAPPAAQSSEWQLTRVRCRSDAI